jgi:hypothetical protein
MRRSGRLLLTVFAAAAATVLAGCTSSGNSATHTSAAIRSTEEPTSSSTSISTGSSRDRPGATRCDPASPITAGPEVQGDGTGATLYGLIMTASPVPIKTDEQVKIVWRMTGSGPLQLSIISPQGKPMPLQWGPEAHGSSNYDRPGSEWGAGYLFTEPGCWHLHAQRTVGAADVWLRVRDSAAAPTAERFRLAGYLGSSWLGH